MVISCSAFGCTNRQGKKSGVSFYRLPSDDERRGKWIAAMKREGWTPGDKARIWHLE